MEPKIIFEDEDILVLDKPAGMIVNRSDTTRDEVTLQDWVEKYLKIPRPKPQTAPLSEVSYAEQSKLDFVNRSGIVHRLDKETSGIILVAKNSATFTNLQAQFRERKVQKNYLALSHGEISPKEGEVNVSVGRLPWNRKRFGVLSGGRESVTEYKVLEVKHMSFGKDNESLSLVELYPKSGRTHQIRVHLQYIKHPIFADPLYAGRKTSKRDRKILPRIFLHASRISFFHPKTNQLLTFEAQIPQELTSFLATLNS